MKTVIIQFCVFLVIDGFHFVNRFNNSGVKCILYQKLQLPLS